MHDPLRVGAGQRFEHLRHQSQRLADPEPPLALERLGERLAGDAREDGVIRDLLRSLDSTQCTAIPIMHS